MAAVTTAAEERYPVRLEIPRPESQSRITNFPLLGIIIRLVLLIPNLLVFWFIALLAGLVGFIASFAILFTGRYPRGMFDFYVGSQRWGANIASYVYHLRDEYPPFSTSAGRHPLSLSVDYPESLSRILNFPFLGQMLKGLLLIPHMVVLWLLLAVVSVTTFISEFAILFAGS